MTAANEAAAVPRLWPTLLSLRSRMSFRFSATGGSAAGLVTDGRGFLFGEYWELPAGWTPAAGSRCRTVPGLRVPARAGGDRDALPFDAVPFDDGSVLLVSRAGLELADADGTRAPSGRLPFRPELTAPAPDGSRAVLFAGPRDDGSWTAWWWSAAEHAARPVAALPPLLARGGWLDTAGHRYAVNVRAGNGYGITPHVLDLRDGSLGPLPLDAPSDHDTVWLTAPAAAEAVLVSHAGSTPRLRTAGPDGIREPASPTRLSGRYSPIAAHPSAGLVALRGAAGTSPPLVALDTVRDTCTALPVEDSALAAYAAWAGDPPHLWAFAAPDALPARMYRTAPGGGRAPGWAVMTDGTEAGGYPWWAPSRLERLPGAEGGIEAVVCGHRDWRTAAQVLLSLHGGPADRTSLKFSQLFQVFADHGITVVAPNPRGSIGCGADFHRQIVGAWGGPDLADVLALARHVRDHRPGGRPLLLHGASYGGFLALLALAAEPGLWHRALAEAPMLSGDLLYPQAGPEVRAMIDRLGGRALVEDELGPRDVLRRLHLITTPLAVVHGADDPVVPPSQSDRLAAELERLGRKPGTDFSYLRVPGAEHSPLSGSAELHEAAARFLATGAWPGLPTA